MSNKSKRLKNLLEYLLKEDNPVAPPESTQDFQPVEQQKDISLDQMLDRYFVRYERESIPTNDVYESTFRNKSFIKEQLEEEEPAEEEPADDLGGEDDGGLGGDLGGDLGDDLGGDEAAPAESGNEAPVLTTPQINLNDFARSVARLANNFQALMDPKSTILNRAEQYITNNYDQRTGQELMQILSTNYGLTPVDQTNSATSTPEFPQPYTAGAWGGGEG